jgi:hypothetical protein
LGLAAVSLLEEGIVILAKLLRDLCFAGRCGGDEWFRARRKQTNQHPLYTGGGEASLVQLPRPSCRETEERGEWDRKRWWVIAGVGCDFGWGARVPALSHLVFSLRFRFVADSNRRPHVLVQYGDEDAIIKCVNDNYGKAENFDPDAETPYRSMTNQHSMYHQVRLHLPPAPPT